MTRSILAVLAALLVGAVLGYLWPRGSTVAVPSAPDEAEPEPLYWVAPMDPNYRRDGPGKSPMGMDLVPVYADDASGSDEPGVRVSPAVAHNLGLELAEVRRDDLVERIRTVGYIAFNEDRISHVHPRTEGWIEVLNATSLGQPVRAGELLFTLYAPDLFNAQQEYLTALADGNARLVRSTRERLRLFGVDSEEIERLRRSGEVRDALPFYSDRDGYVSHLGVRRGMYVRPADEILAIGDLRDVWVLAEVFERQLPAVRVGASVRIRHEGWPEREWQGTVDYVYPTLDSPSRTGRVRVVLPNEDEALRANVAVDVEIDARHRPGALVVPRQAVIRTATGDRVVAQVGTDRYVPVPVQVGLEVGDRVEIVAGLEAGALVVTSAQFLIDSEAALGAEFDRLAEPPVEHDHDAMSHDDDTMEHDHGAMEHDHGAMEHGHEAMEHDHGTVDAGR
jgi:Cu(I)/Ag(I) efflux system membrane fusion protein